MTQQPTVTLEDAYREACTALGEAIVRERLTARLAAPPTDETPTPPGDEPPRPGDQTPGD